MWVQGFGGMRGICTARGRQKKGLVLPSSFMVSNVMIKGLSYATWMCSTLPSLEPRQDRNFLTAGFQVHLGYTPNS